MDIKNFADLKSLLFDNKTIKQTILKNTFWLMLAEGISKGLAFFLTIMIARYLGAEGYGIFSFVFAFVALFAVLADFGLSTLTIREVARDKSLARKYIDNIAVIKLILGLITFGLIIGIIQFLGKTPEVKTLVYLAGIWVIIQNFTQFFQSIFRAFEKMQYEAISKIAYSLLLFLIAGFILWQNLEIKLLVSSYIAAASISFILTLILVRKKITKFWTEIDFGFWRELLKEAWPFAVILIISIIYFRIDTIMLSVMKTDTVVGWYNAAYAIIVAGLFIPDIVMGAIFPSMSKFFKISKNSLIKSYSESFKYLFIIALPVALGISILSDRFILLLYGAEFSASIIALRILIWALFLIFLNYVFTTLMTALNKQRIIFLFVAIGAIVNIFLNLLLIPQLSYIGASITTVITELLLFILYFSFIWKQSYKLPLNKIIIRPTFAGLVMILFIYYFKNINLLILIISSIVIYGALLCFLRVFSIRKVF